MYYLKWLLALTVVGTVSTALSGCQDISGNELVTSIAELTFANNDKPEEEESADSSFPEVSAQVFDNTPNGVVNVVMDAINHGDAATLAKYMAKSSDDPIQAAEAAIADYQTYFLNSRLVGFQPIDAADAAAATGADSTSRYELISEAGLTKEITVIQQADQIQVSDEFLDYSGMAKARMSSFVGALQNQNAEQLAAALSTPQATYSTAWAERAIALYQDRMNLDTLAFKFVDLEPFTQQFTYSVVSKTPEGYELTHDVTVTFGDGQVEIQDSWIP
ncbi:MAG: hypothetical protein ACTS2F_26745 [Thainema sp.]